MASLFFLLAGSIHAAPTYQQLTNELARVREDVADAHEAIAEQNKKLRQEQHDLEYGEPAIRKLREDIVALEKQLIEKRAELQARIELVPAMKELEEQRRELFHNLQDLQATEQAILNEIKALEAGGHAP